MTYVESRVQENPAAPVVPLDPLGHLVTFVGEAFPNTPRWQGDLNADYTREIKNNLLGFVGASVTDRSGTSAAFGNSPYYKIDGYGLLDLRAGVETTDGRWRFALFGRNVTDRYYWQSVTRFGDVVARLTGYPTTYGISGSYRY